MNPPCAFCKKTVYPTEKFNCLDKIWHKGCFKCTECSLKLTMNTYKGYNKMPYCKAHYPHLKATQVAVTAEAKRLQNISKQQSQVEYHKSYNLEKGSKLSVADDPETMRQKKVSANQSNVVYQNRAAKKAEEELKRPQGDNQPEPEYDPVKELESAIGPGWGGYNAAGQAPRKIGSIHDYNIEDEHHGFSPAPQQPGGGSSYRPPPPEPVVPAQPRSPVFRAMYDYTAADTDEVSFVEGDKIINAEAIDEGWMTGTVERTGHTGMMPSNYVEIIN